MTSRVQTGTARVQRGGLLPPTPTTVPGAHMAQAWLRLADNYEARPVVQQQQQIQPKKGDSYPSARLRTRSLPHLRHSITWNCSRKGEGCMALRLCDVERDTIANRALNELMHHYSVAEEKDSLVLTKKAGDMTLFLHDLDDLHQLDFVQNKQMVKEIERLRRSEQQRESWKIRALMAEAQLREATTKIGNNGACHNVTDVRYASFKRYLAKQFHPDYSPGEGIERIIRNEMFKEIWNEVGRLDQGASAGFATARSSSAA